MIVLKILLCGFWLFLVPFILGKFLIKKDENEIIYSWILGNVLQMGIFFVVSIPLIIIKEKFTKLLYIYMVLILVLLIISCIFNRKKFKSKIELKKISAFQIIAILLIFLQLFIKFKYANINNDDASFVTLSTAMIETDKMYLHDENGNELNNIISRRALAPISAYYSVLSKLLNIHVAIVTHTIMPIIFILLAYCVYYYFGKKLFKEKDSIFIFLILLSILNLYAFSYKGYNRYLILYTWFGRAILAGIILPFMWKISIDAMNKEENKFIDWITLFFCVLAGCLCSEMAVPLIAISVGVLALISTVRDKKISYLLKSFVCILPCVIVGIIYLVIK
ncbi:MAG: DUF6077 domain-containing protein [Candidatus Scatovivens sp.]